MSVLDRKAREFQRREEEILAAALALFGKDDWQSVTVEAIANRAEIGKGTVYKHFASKEEIYARLANQFSLRMLRQVEALDTTLPVRTRLRELIRIVWQEHTALAPEYQRVVQYCERADFIDHLGPVLRRETREIIQRFGRLVTSLFQAGISQGVFPDRPVPLLVFRAHAALVGAVRLLWNGDYPGSDPAAALPELTRFIEAGLELRPDPV